MAGRDISSLPDVPLRGKPPHGQNLSRISPLCEMLGEQSLRNLDPAGSNPSGRYSMNRLQFVNYDARFLELSWEWLTNPEVKQLAMTPDFTREGQAQWFATLPNRTDYAIWGLTCD